MPKYEKEREEMANQLELMTNRQKEVLGLIARGFSNAEIAAELFVQPRTVEHHINAIYGILALNSTGGDNARVKAVLVYQQECQIADTRTWLIGKIDKLLDEVRI